MSMSMSVVAVHKDSVDVFNSLRLKGEYRYAFFKIGLADGKKAVIPDYKEPASQNDDRSAWTEMKQKLENLNEPRYVLFDFRKVKAIVCLVWLPADHSLSERMDYVSAWNEVEKAFAGLRLYKEYKENNSLDFDTIFGELMKKLDY